MLTTERKRIVLNEVQETINMMKREQLGYGYIQNLSGSNTFEKNNKYAGLYTNATEDIRGYSKEFPEPTTALTITGSGDQVLNLINMGAKEIDAFDLNPLAKRACGLRIAAVKTLPQNLFHAYYRTFASNLFVQVAEALTDEEKLYWHSLYDALDSENIRKNLFHYFKLEKDLLKQINPYLDQSSYEDMKKKIEDVKINYIDCDIFDLPNYIGEKKYDIMNFSNTYEYVNYGVDTNYKLAKKYYDFIMNEMRSHLTDNGEIMVAYMYAFSDSVKKEFDKWIKAGEQLVLPGAINFFQLEDYLKGLTTQNFSYSLLLELFKNDPVKMIPTTHVQFGQSIDMSHDLALLLKK